jgi:hypothetical protein
MAHPPVPRPRAHGRLRAPCADAAPPAGAQDRFLQRAAPLCRKPCSIITGSASCFDACIAVEQHALPAQAGWCSGFLRLLRGTPRPAPLHHGRGQPDNLKTAKKLGMKTVWVSTGLRGVRLGRRRKSVLGPQLPRRCGATIISTAARIPQTPEGREPWPPSRASASCRFCRPWPKCWRTPKGKRSPPPLLASPKLECLRSRALPPLRQQGADVRRPDRVHRNSLFGVINQITAEEAKAQAGRTDHRPAAALRPEESAA